MSQVNRKGEKPASSPALEEAIRRQRADNRAPTLADHPPLSTLLGPRVHVHEGQLSLSSPSTPTQPDEPEGFASDRLKASRQSEPSPAA